MPRLPPEAPAGPSQGESRQIEPAVQERLPATVEPRFGEAAPATGGLQLGEEAPAANELQLGEATPAANELRFGEATPAPSPRSSSEEAAVIEGTDWLDREDGSVPAGEAAPIRPLPEAESAETPGRRGRPTPRTPHPVVTASPGVYRLVRFSAPEQITPPPVSRPGTGERARPGSGERPNPSRPRPTPVARATPPVGARLGVGQQAQQAPSGSRSPAGGTRPGLEGFPTPPATPAARPAPLRPATPPPIPRSDRPKSTILGIGPPKPSEKK